jgi:hypothetical protein
MGQLLALRMLLAAGVRMVMNVGDLRHYLQLRNM